MSTCPVLITRGDRKGQACGVSGRCRGGRCAAHATAPVTRPTCCYTLTRGKNKGKPCCKPVVDNANHNCNSTYSERHGVSNARPGHKNLCSAHWLEIYFEWGCPVGRVKNSRKRYIDSCVEGTCSGCDSARARSRAIRAQRKLDRAAKDKENRDRPHFVVLVDRELTAEESEYARHVEFEIEPEDIAVAPEAPHDDQGEAFGVYDSFEDDSGDEAYHTCDEE